MRTLTTTHQNSILVTWVKAFGRALDAAGCDGSALLAQAGFDLRHLGGPAARCPLTKTGRLWRVAPQATGGEALRGQPGRYFTPPPLHPPGHGVGASSAPQKALQRGVRGEIGRANVWNPVTATTP